MADSKITELTELVTGAIDDIIPIVDISELPITTKKIRLDNLVNASLEVQAATSHIANTSNPHGTTKAQVGLSEVDNTSDADKPVSTATQAALDLKANSSDVYTKVESDTNYEPKNANIQSHISSIANPHGVTKSQVGLGNVDNTSDATKNTAIATLTNKTLTAPVITSPTGIVKADVGLGNVDNTSDVNKPVSTAQAAADSAVQAFSIQRANHTGTQLASTISNFAATVIATLLTGYAVGSDAVLAATDSILAAFQKVQGQINAMRASVTPSSTSSTNSAGVNAALAKADHTHNTEIVNGYAEGTVDATTTSTTFVDIADMSITLATAGKYLINFSGAILNSANGADRARVILNNNGSTIASSERRVGTAGGAIVPVATQAIVNVTAATTVKAQFRSVAGTTTINERNFTAIRLGA